SYLILAFDIEAQANHLRIGARRCVNVVVHYAKDATPSRFFPNIDALNPPNPAVAPIAELKRDAQLAEDGALFFSQEVKALWRVGEHGRPAALHPVPIERFGFRFLCQAAVKLHNNRRIGGRCRADLHWHGCLNFLQLVSSLKATVAEGPPWTSKSSFE